MNTNDKFAHSEEDAVASGESGGMVLTADGCMARHNIPRIDELNERTEEVYTGKSEWNKEQRLWAFAYDLLQHKGLRPRTEDLEEFVKSHLELEAV